MKKIVSIISIAVSVVVGMGVGFASTNVFADPEVVTVTKTQVKRVEVPVEVEVEVEKTPMECGDAIYYSKRALNADRRILNEMNNLFGVVSNAYRAGWYGEPTTDIDAQVYDIQAEISDLSNRRNTALDQYWAAERDCMDHVLADSGEGEDPYADENVGYDN